MLYYETGDMSLSISARWFKHFWEA